MTERVPSAEDLDARLAEPFEVRPEVIRVHPMVRAFGPAAYDALEALRCPCGRPRLETGWLCRHCAEVARAEETRERKAARKAENELKAKVLGWKKAPLTFKIGERLAAPRKRRS